MFEQTIYILLIATYSADKTKTEWREEGIKALELKNGKIFRVTTDSDALLDIDDVTAFARRSTGMFDKKGTMLLGGDLVKFNHIHAQEEAKDVIAPILWVNGAYAVVIPTIDELIYLTQQNVMEMEKIGNIYQHGKILEMPVDEAIFHAQNQE